MAADPENPKTAEEEHLLLRSDSRWPQNYENAKRVGAAIELLAYAVRVAERIDEYDELLKKDCNDFQQRLDPQLKPDFAYNTVVSFFDEGETAINIAGQTIEVLPELSLSTLRSLESVLYSLRELCCRIDGSQHGKPEFSGFQHNGSLKYLTIYREQPMDANKWTSFYHQVTEKILRVTTIDVEDEGVIDIHIHRGLAWQIAAFFFKRRHYLAVNVEELEAVIQDMCTKDDKNGSEPWIQYDASPTITGYFVVSSPYEFIFKLIDRLHVPSFYKSAFDEEDVLQYATTLGNTLTDIQALRRRKQPQLIERKESDASDSAKSERSESDQQSDVGDSFATTNVSNFRYLLSDGYPEENTSASFIDGLSVHTFRDWIGSLRPSFFGPKKQTDDSKEEKDDGIGLDSNSDDLITLKRDGTSTCASLKREIAERSKFIKSGLAADPSTTEIAIPARYSDDAFGCLIHCLENDLHSDWVEEFKKMETSKLIEFMELLLFMDMKASKALTFGCFTLAFRIQHQVNLADIDGWKIFKREL